MVKELRITLMLSIAMHVIFMSLFNIVNPVRGEKIRQYTKVDFLGPILRKTAFDIMIENADPVMTTAYSEVEAMDLQSYLKITPVSKISQAKIHGKTDAVYGNEEKILDFLKDSKRLPAVFINKKAKKSDLTVAPYGE